MLFKNYYSAEISMSSLYDYDLIDLQYDNPKLLEYIIQQAIDSQINDDLLYENSSSGRISELKMINSLIIESSIEILSTPKSKLLDAEITRIKAEFYWQNIETDDKIETIYWQDSFDNFISFMRQRNQTKMVDIFDLDVDLLRNAGFSPRFISEITSIFIKWSEKQLDNEIEIDEVDNEITNDGADEFNNANDNQDDVSVNDLLSLFFHTEEEAI